MNRPGTQSCCPNLPRSGTPDAMCDVGSLQPPRRTYAACRALNTRDTDCHANAYWQSTSNWKKVAFRNLLLSPDFHRGTHLGCITRFRDSWASSRLLGLAGWGGESRDFVTANQARARKSRNTCTKRARPASSHRQALFGSRRVAEPDQMEAAARTRNGYRNSAPSWDPQSFHRLWFSLVQ